MQAKIVGTILFSGLLFLYAFRYNLKPADSKLKFISREEVYKNKFRLQCSPDWSSLNSDSLAKGISILKGWGNYSWDINSGSDSAKLYFQQGISMYYAFHIIEAMASFKKAEQFDDTNAMIFWGQALAYGPNINDFAYSYTPEAFAVAQKAISLSSNCSPREKLLIKAMGMRYVSDSTVSRASLNQLYTDEMQKGYRQFPGDPDVATLYADAMMLQHPWEYWKHNGDAQPWTPQIVQVLEKTLERSPVHPGANHYYIHMVEASHNPGRALPSAARLSKLMPSVSHMVHMPSHIYIRTGRYNEGTKVNEMSLNGYNEYLSVYPDVANNAPLYQIHNLHMQTACAMMGKGYNYSAKSAKACRASFDTPFMSIPAPLGGYIQYVYMVPVINEVRFGKWAEILKAPAISENYVYAKVLEHWARGFALARTNDIASAKNELELLRANMNKPDMLVVLEPFNAPIAGAKVMEKFLAGIIAEQENDLVNAEKLLTAAVENEAGMVYNEPKDWIVAVRPYLGAVLLKARSFSKAEQIFKGDLKENPNNHWSLKGLYESLQKQQKRAESLLVKKQLDKTVTLIELKDLPVVF